MIPEKLCHFDKSGISESTSRRRRNFVYETDRVRERLVGLEPITDSELRIYQYSVTPIIRLRIIHKTHSAPTAACLHPENLQSPTQDGRRSLLFAPPSPFA